MTRTRKRAEKQEAEAPETPVKRGRQSMPTFKTVNALLEKKAEAIAMLEEVNKELKKMVEKYGEVRFDYELPEDMEGPAGEKYLKFELVDNIARMNRGEDVFTSSKAQPATMDSRFLKRIPDSLK